MEKIGERVRSNVTKKTPLKFLTILSDIGLNDLFLQILSTPMIRPFYRPRWTIFCFIFSTICTFFYIHNRSPQKSGKEVGGKIETSFSQATLIILDKIILNISLSLVESNSCWFNIPRA